VSASAPLVPSERDRIGLGGAVPDFAGAVPKIGFHRSGRIDLHFANAGSISTGYAYGPFGQTTASGATSGNPIQYTGREMDPTSFLTSLSTSWPGSWACCWSAGTLPG